MLAFFCKSRVLITKISVEDLDFLRCSSTVSPILRSFSSSSSSSNGGVSGSKQGGRHSLTLSYLINSCGLSPQSALYVSKRVHFKTIKKPDSVLAFLRDQGFTDEHFPRLVRGCPQLLLSNHQKSILPKFQFLYSIGFSRSDLVKIFHSCPRIFCRSLNGHIIPCYNLLKSLVKSDEKVTCTMRRNPIVLALSLNQYIISNLSLLREHGMPESFFSCLVTCYGPLLRQPHVKFSEKLERLIDMGFDPKKTPFIHAMQVLFSRSRTTFEHKMEVYKRWGLSEHDVQLAFRKYPICMNYSEQKIMAVMDFLVNEIGWPPAAIARTPTVIGMSLKKRIVPRCSVAKVLQMKGLVKRSFISNTIFCINEEKFLDKFVRKYEQQVPQLLALYQGKVGFVELGVSGSIMSEIY